MNTVLSNTRNANLQIITALAIMIVVLLTFAVIPSISVPQRAAIPETNSQKAYVEFLSGEKVMYGSPARLNEALAAYHLGEKAISASTVEWTSVLSTYLAGEKGIYSQADAVAVWSAGEKSIVPFEVVEAALWEHRMGEKGLK